MKNEKRKMKKTGRHSPFLIPLSSFLIPLFLILTTCTSTPQANQDEVSLGTAIRQAAAQIESGLERGTKIALINFTSSSQAFSDYVLDELSSVLVNNRHLIVVDRANLDRIRQELGFNASGEVSDKSMQEIGQMLGAQALVTGSLTSIADLRRVMFKVIMTETAAVAVQYPADIINDRRVQALLAQGGDSQSAAYASANYGNTTSTGNSRGNTASGNRTTQTQTQPATPAYPRSGTYTFFPRLQPYQGATRHQGNYLWKIVVRGEYMSIFITEHATGDATKGEPNDWRSDARPVIQDLDNPSRSWTAEGGRWAGYSWGDEGQWFNFRGVTATRFSLTSNDFRPPSVFEEINLENAQYTP